MHNPFRESDCWLAVLWSRNTCAGEMHDAPCRVPALAFPPHMLSIWLRVSVASEGQLLTENNDSSVETLFLSLLFSLNLTTLFHTSLCLTWLLSQSLRHGTNLQIFNTESRIYLSPKHQESCMNSSYWKALHGDHFAESQIFPSMLRAGSLSWFEPIALPDKFCPTILLALCTWLEEWMNDRTHQWADKGLNANLYKCD